jgi:N-acetylneuraminate lyase
MEEHTSGLIAAPFTPLHPDGAVNLEPVEAQLHALVNGGVRGAFVCGTTGESLSLSLAERQSVAERWTAVAPDDFTVIVHVGALCLSECRALAEHAQSLGVHAIGAMPPCFFQPDTLGDLVDWCAQVAEAAPELPFYYYHIPAMTGIDIDVADFLEAALDRIPTLAGAKFTYENLMDYARCVRLHGGRFDLLFGRDEILLAALALGARGAVGTTYNFAGPLYRRIIHAYEAADMATAQAEQARAIEMIAVLLSHGGMPAFKAVMKMIGIDCGPVRPPLASLTDEECADLRAELEEIGFFDYCSKV